MVPGRPGRIALLARTWVGTPFRLGGRGAAGLDCLGLILRIGWDLGEALPDATGYGLLGDGPRLRAWLEANLVPLRCVGEAGPGDVVALRLRLGWEHVGVFGWLHGGLSLIHVHTSLPGRDRRTRTGCCVEHGWAPPWSGRAAAAYRYRSAGGW